MADSVYRVTEVVGVSSESWEAAARVAVETAADTVRELRVAEVLRQDLTIQDGAVVNFRVRLSMSFALIPTARGMWGLVSTTTPSEAPR
ncbi:MAG: dodecin family protein [Solirubrobacteraceae bacterium]